MSMHSLRHHWKMMVGTAYIIFIPTCLNFQLCILHESYGSYETTHLNSKPTSPSHDSAIFVAITCHNFIVMSQPRLWNHHFSHGFFVAFPTAPSFKRLAASPAHIRIGPADLALIASTGGARWFPQRWSKNHGSILEIHQWMRKIIYKW